MDTIIDKSNQFTNYEWWATLDQQTEPSPQSIEPVNPQCHIAYIQHSQSTWTMLHILCENAYNATCQNTIDVRLNEDTPPIQRKTIHIRSMKEHNGQNEESPPIWFKCTAGMIDFWPIKVMYFFFNNILKYIHNYIIAFIGDCYREDTANSCWGRVTIKWRHMF